MDCDVWHGTNQEFGRFDRGALGLANPNAASSLAFFFAADPVTAWDYACKAARSLVPAQAEHEARVAQLLDDANEAERKRDFRSAERFIAEAERLEAEALWSEPAGARVLRCRLRLDNPVEVDGGRRDIVVDLGSVLQKALEDGHDGVILRGIHDTPSGEGPVTDHFAVFDPEKIEILEVVLAEEPEPELEAHGL
ncbi:hypothetical protein LAZ40_03315 [Cereibacter sphaeroides]|uniref:hypothetical protein n=1 Tax=Cereibacter sphaeroides TaxID=1063 RepID=UPI001F35A960|nr:hypothetical protein [Cereibacter sphaeroides]MCE6958085.1 hypothetical protein [Cereibacter sphaeroides]MCE6971428.1 hypothetical protein [Cereibacter sphaeroides]